jgi:lipid II:glycine glycyltransferase (peptidoglycan interpeptide bridge formation enzyme)
LELEVGSDDQLLDWMMARHAELLEDRDFDGPPAELLLAWRRNLDETEPFIVLRAMSEDEPIAGICLTCHGSAATYLLGWNGPRGRALRAHQFLLWQAVVHLKQTGVRWFDLGGIDEEGAPGITEFKLGLNGERYELVGEYWKW